MDEQRLKYLIEQFTGNVIKRAEYEELMDYLRKEQPQSALFESMDAEWKKTERIFSAELQEQALYSKILSDPRFKQRQNKSTAFRPFLHIPVAASILLICIAGFFMLKRDSKPVTEPLRFKERRVSAGAKLKLMLPDGTRVWINSASKFKFPETFSDTSREVYLEGEAYFDVAHDAGKPFIIHTGDISTRVLGTAFNLSAYDTKKVTVTVTRGRVRVSDGQRRLAELVRNKQLRYNRDTRKAELNIVDAGDFASWINGELILNNVSMEEAAEKISRWYDVDFSFSSSKIKRCRFSVTFLNGEKLSKVLQVISELNGFKYRIEKRKVILSGKGC